MFPSNPISSNQFSRRQFMAGSAAMVAATAFAQDQSAFRVTPRVDKVNIGVVATPDHNHAIVSIHAMKMGKHVYCEKPLTRTIYEARQMAKVAKEMNVQTQMGTQGHAFEGTRQAVEVIRSGAIGDVNEIYVWSDRPGSWWQHGIDRPTGTPPVPPTLDWDTWLGPAAERPYNKAYVPFTWRGFWDFGTGAIGDMGIHNFDTAFWALELGLPTSVEVIDTSGVNTETGPKWCIIVINL